MSDLLKGSDAVTATVTERAAEESGRPDPADAASSPRGPLGRLASSGFTRIAGISASLVGTQALTSVLGLLFWALAARQFATADVGIAGAAVALMMLLGSLGSFGLGTVLIARLPHTEAADRRVLVRTCVAAAFAGGAVLGAAVPAAAVHLFGATALAPVAGSAAPLLLLAAGTGLTAAVMVLDQAVLTIGFGTLQLERNVTASAVKVVALLALGFGGVEGGMTIFLAWAIGNAVSLPLVAWRTRGGRSVARPSGVVEPRLLHGLSRLALSHHALNVSIQAALQLLPVLVTVLVSAQENARFNAAIMIAGFVFALPYAVSVGLFAAARGDEAEVVQRMRLTIPFGLGVSALASLVLFPLAEPVLHIFGPQYAAQGADLLRLVVLAGIPFVIKDHFIALRRVQGRTTEALVVCTVFLVLELAAAAAGAFFGGARGLIIGWLSVLVVEALILMFPLIAARRHGLQPRASTTQEESAQEESVQVEASEDTGAMAFTDAEVASAAPVVGLGSGDWPGETEAVSRPSWFHRNLAGPTLLVASLGVLVLTVAANTGRAGDTGPAAQAGWILGLCLIFVPAAVRVIAPATPHAERMIVVVGLAMILQVSRLVLTPTAFAFHDEFIHANTLRLIVESNHLFSFNPLLPVSSYYPGLEIVTDALHALTGLPLFASATLTLLLARVISVLAVVGLVSAVAGSRRAGAVGALIYLTNPQQLFFNSQYSYQTLALPLAVWAVYLVATRRRGGRWSLVLPIATTAAVALTHHLTAVSLIGAWALWLAVVLIRGRHIPDGTSEAAASRRLRDAASDRKVLIVLTLLSAAATVVSVFNSGNPLRDYLEAIFGSSATDLVSLAQGRQSKTLFADTAGTGAAPWEQVLMVASVLVVTASLLIALGFIRSNWRAARPLALMLGLVALLYPIIPGGHLTRATAEVGDRAAGFIFVGVAVVLGVWWWQRKRSARVQIAAVVACVVVFLGNVILGSGPTANQLPGPYQISNDARSVDADNIAAAEWLSVGVPKGSTVYADRVSGLMAAAIGGQTTVRHVSTNIDASRVLLAPTYTSQDRALIRRARLDYLIVDRRLSNGLPHLQFYIESGEYGGPNLTKPVTAAALAKFAAVPGVERIYDNGSIAIYDIRGLR